MGHCIKQHFAADYRGCQVDSKLSGKAIASKVLEKIDPKQKYLYRQDKLCNALIQPHFDYGCLL